MSKGGINEFLTALFASEGGGVVDIENKFGYLGKYQFGEDALHDLGYYKGDDSKNRTASDKFKYDWIGEWTGKNGATGKDVFLGSASIQDMAARDWVALLCKNMKHFDLAKYIGETMGGVLITESGIIAAAHLKGFGNKKHPGVIQFLRSNGAVNGEDAFGTSVSDYIGKFADYDLGCCKHVAITLLDREKQPLPKLPYEVKRDGQVVKKGKTDDKGWIPKFAMPSGQSAYEVFVQRIEGGMKKIAHFPTPAQSALITLMSPKVAVAPALEPHKGQPGKYKSGAAEKKRSAPVKGKAATSSERGQTGKPVALAHAPPAGSRKLSGAEWVRQFPTSKSLKDLLPKFSEKVGKFIAALEAGGAEVRPAATFRPRERAYLMHYCCKIASGEIAPAKVPPMEGVNIEWAHRDGTGEVDVAASKAAARAMMKAYDIQYPAALVSRHTERRAIDMSITGWAGKIFKNADGKDVKVDDKNALFDLGRTFGVIKLIKDRPHWSDDGH